MGLRKTEIYELQSEGRFANGLGARTPECRDIEPEVHPGRLGIVNEPSSLKVPRAGIEPAT
jgi:hypothetical protein